MNQTDLDHTPFILPINSNQATLALAGGKGANLSQMARAGFPVPHGFIISTHGYREYLTANQLENKVFSFLSDIDSSQPENLESISEQIRALFSAGTIPDVLANEIRRAYQNSGTNFTSSKAVAVRSSATAEDLPEMSFAGQQDTYLNVIGIDNLLEAVINCWSSLWTARAIGYRIRNRVPHQETALAVIIQEMVESQASGVLFTANPLTGLRSETVIDSTIGLGEALVSGQVEPDHFVVSTSDGKILSKTLGTKAISIHGKSNGGTKITQQTRNGIQSLPDNQIINLVEIGSQVANLYGFPQDIEWASAKDSLFILQSRPITSLFPLPEGLPVEPFRAFFSFAAVQGFLDPITPLGQDAVREVFATGARLFGVLVTRATQSVIYTAGERLWVNFTAILSNSVGRRILPNIFSMVEPSTRQAIEMIWTDPRFQPSHKGISFGALKKILRFLIPLAGNVFLNLLQPKKRREYIIENSEHILKMVKSHSENIKGDRWNKLAQQADLLPEFAMVHFPNTFLLFVSGVAAGMAAWNFLNILANQLKDDQKPSQISTRDLVLQITRGMPHNPTTEMDLNLWEVAKDIRHDPELRQLFLDTPGSILSNRYLSGHLPPTVQQAVEAFLEQYGGRGLGEIDLGRPRWAEDPTYIFETLKGYLRIEDESKAPDIIFARGAESAQQAIYQLSALVRKTHLGWLKARLVPIFSGRARELMGARENPKFFAVRLFWIVRHALVNTGLEFMQAGDLKNADDLLFLTFSELKSFAAQEQGDWRGLIQKRRDSYQREFLRKQIPRLLLSDGRAFYEGVFAAENTGDELKGSPVSPGSVEGRVRVVLNPTQAGLLPGEILVCPGTDPSWTPLFLSAAGLVMEVGGMMTHGAVVAREYGIPAIVGVDQATTLLHTGQLIRINGSTGQISILDEEFHSENN